MPRPTKIFEKLPFLTNGDTLVGLAFAITGIIVFYSGITKLWDLWARLHPFLPLRLPEHVGDMLLKSLPSVLTYFISTVSALSASLLGILWVFTGLGDAIRRKEDSSEPAEYKQPEMTAESLRTGLAVHWREFSWFFRLLAARWTRMRRISPVCLEVFRDIMRSSVKVVVLWVVILLIFQGLHMIPDLAKRLLQLNMRLGVPAPGPLYGLLAIALIVNVIIAVSLVPLRIPQFVCSSQSMWVRGRGDPQLFFALLEESCKLLSHKGLPERRPIRLYHEENPQVKGTIIESCPESVFTASRPAAYCGLPLVVIFICTGFSRLIDFSRPVPEMNHVDFLSLYLLDYLLEVAFAAGLILLGLYFSDWARRLFGLRKYRSSLVFCHLQPPQNQDPDTSRTARSSKTSKLSSVATPWHLSEGVDAKFTMWAKDPRPARRFQIELYWAEAGSESVDDTSARFLVHTRRSETLDALMARIISLPFHVGFEAGDATPRPGSATEPPMNERAKS